MTTPTEASLLALVQQQPRYSKLTAAQQAHLAKVAVHVLNEPQWIRMKVTPDTALQIAASRVKHRKSF